jgi:single-strand DNA-binding protein
MDANLVIVDGYITRDGEIKTVNGGFTVVNSSLCWNKGHKVNDEWVNTPNYFAIYAWNPSTDEMALLKKGKKLMIVGQLQYQSWTDSDGKSHHEVKIECTNISPSKSGKSKSKNDKSTPDPVSY